MPSAASVDLAVPDGILRRDDTTDPTISKLGGQPALPNKLLSSVQQEFINRKTLCDRCGHRLFLLAQCYCPTTDDYNRTMLLFGCNSATCCEDRESWRCISLEYPYGSEDEADEEEEAEDDDERFVDDLPVKAALPEATFPPTMLTVVPEPESNDEEQSPVDQQEQYRLMEETNRKARESLARCKGVSAEEVASLTDDEIRQELEGFERSEYMKQPSKQDIAFERFLQRLQLCPKQALRYQRPTTKPLFMDSTQVKKCIVPPCPGCGEARVCELQMMSTVVYHLGCDRYLDGWARCGDDGLDFSTISVYVCGSKQPKAVKAAAAAASGAGEQGKGPQGEEASRDVVPFHCPYSADLRGAFGKEVLSGNGAALHRGHHYNPEYTDAHQVVAPVAGVEGVPDGVVVVTEEFFVLERPPVGSPTDGGNTSGVDEISE